MMTEKIKHSTFDRELRDGKSITYFTIGSSMRPLLFERETHVTVAPMSEVKPKDVLLYIRPCGDYVLHRCMKVDAEHYYMRGDNTYGYEKIKKEQAIGKVICIYRRGKCFDTENKKYRLYVCLWNFIYPIRFLIWKVKRLVEDNK